MIQFQAYGATVKIWPSEVIGIVLFVGVIFCFWRATIDPKNPIDIAHMFVWPGTRQTSAAIVLAFCGGIVAMWVVIDQELKSNLNADIFIGFLATVVAGKAATETINAWRNRNPSSPRTHDGDDDRERAPPAVDEDADGHLHQRRLEADLAGLKRQAVG